MNRTIPFQSGDVATDSDRGAEAAEGLAPISSTIAYLVGHYPGASETFILREILAMRRAGFSVVTTSVREPDVPKTGFTQIEQEEADRTFYVQRQGAVRILWDQLVALTTRPLAYVRGARKALSMAGLDLRLIVYHLIYLAEAVTLGRWLSKNQVKHVHVHFANNTCTVALLVKKVFGIPYSVSVHGPNEFYDVYRQCLSEKVEGALFARCISNFCRSQLMFVTSPDQWRKFDVCRLGVDPDNFQPRPAPRNEVVTLLCVGRLVPAKGQMILLHAAAQLLGEGIRFHIYFAGGGPDADALATEASRLGLNETVTFCGSVNQDLLANYWKNADVFVLPSFAEGVPVALMEAMSKEIPCISTPVGGISELIESGVDGILVPPSDSVALADAIRRLVLSPKLREDLGRAGRQKILRLYDLRQNAGQMAQLLARRLSAVKDL